MSGKVDGLCVGMVSYSFSLFFFQELYQPTHCPLFRTSKNMDTSLDLPYREGGGYPRKSLTHKDLAPARCSGISVIIQLQFSGNSVIMQWYPEPRRRSPACINHANPNLALVMTPILTERRQSVRIPRFSIHAGGNSAYPNGRTIPNQGHVARRFVKSHPSVSTRHKRFSFANGRI